MCYCYQQNNDASIDEGSNKPEMICFYNKTKGGVDTVDQMCSTYSVSRKSNRWPLTVFFPTLNVAGINAQIIYRENSKDEKSRREFLKALGLELVQEHLAYRSTLPFLPRDIKLQINKFIQKQDQAESTGKNCAAQPYRLTGRCQICPPKKDRKHDV